MVGAVAMFAMLMMYSGHVDATKGSPEKVLRDKLFTNYDKTVRPVLDHNTAVNVSFGLRLSKLAELNTKKQLLVIDAWIVQTWMNPFLAWNESEHHGLHTLHVPADNMWAPDTVLYDNGDEEVAQAGFTEKFKTYVMLESSGLCTWMAPATFKSSCDIDITNFPFDSQRCSMTFGSWTYDNRLLSLKQLHKRHDLAAKYVMNGDWTVRNVSIENRLIIYSTGYPFSDVTYTFTLDRKPAYHVLYLIVPCVIISCMSILTFFLPPDCGERVGLSITLFLALAVYLLIVSDILPETSDYVPRLGLYYMVIMGEIALVVAVNAGILRCHFSRSKPPRFVTRFRRSDQAVRPMESKAALSMVMLDANSQASESEPSQNGKVQHAEEEKPKPEDEKEAWAECWKDFARRLDIMFLVVFVLLFLVSSIATLFSRKAHKL